MKQSFAFCLGLQHELQVQTHCHYTSLLLLMVVVMVLSSFVRDDASQHPFRQFISDRSTLHRADSVVLVSPEQFLPSLLSLALESVEIPRLLCLRPAQGVATIPLELVQMNAGLLGRF